MYDDGMLLFYIFYKEKTSPVVTLEKLRGKMPCGYQGQRALSRSNSKCKGPEVRIHLVGPRINKKAAVEVNKSW